MALQATPSRRQLLTRSMLGGAALALAPSFLTPPAPAKDHEAEDPRDEAFLPTGQQFEITYGSQRLLVTETGAVLRSYTVDGQEFLLTFDGATQWVGSSRPGSRGQLLAPWPARVNRGQYLFGSPPQLLQLPVEGTHAIHGLVRWVNFQVAHQDRRRLTLEYVLHPQPGYPFVIHLRQHYALGRDGLRVTHVARNVGTVPAPYGMGQHPYFTVGTSEVDSCLLRLPAQRYLPQSVDGIPLPPAVPVEGTVWDFRAPRPIGPANLAAANSLTDFIREADGLARASLQHPSGSPTVTLSMDGNIPWILAFIAAFTGGRVGIALEPYTCASDAFNNGLGLRVLQPGETFQASWGVAVTG